jgi:hypothetical protein
MSVVSHKIRTLITLANLYMLCYVYIHTILGPDRLVVVPSAGAAIGEALAVNTALQHLALTGT